MNRNFKNNRKFSINILSTVALFFIFFPSCKEEDISKIKLETSRTIIVYMAADNDLSTDALSDLEVLSIFRVKCLIYRKSETTKKPG
jgi:hypothetical protein